MPTRLRANPAMLVHVRMALAFVAAYLTRENARMQLRMHDLVRRFRLPHQQRRRRIADIRTVQIRADAPPQLPHVLLRQTRIRTRPAHLRTLRQRLQHLRVMPHSLCIRPRMRA